MSFRPGPCTLNTCYDECSRHAENEKRKWSSVSPATAAFAGAAVVGVVALDHAAVGVRAAAAAAAEHAVGVAARVRQTPARTARAASRPLPECSPARSPPTTSPAPPNNDTPKSLLSPNTSPANNPNPGKVVPVTAQPPTPTTAAAALVARVAQAPGPSDPSVLPAQRKHLRWRTATSFTDKAA